MRNASTAALLTIASVTFFGTPVYAQYNGNKAFERIVRNYADPSIVKGSNNVYFLAGTTGADGNPTTIDIYRSANLQHFSKHHSYNPTSPTTKYCHIWAPDLSISSPGRYLLTFSAYAVPVWKPCPRWGEPGVTLDYVNKGLKTYFVESSNLKDFTGPNPRSFLVGNRTYGPSTGFGEQSIKIDGHVAGGRFFYVWFGQGNAISSISLSSPHNKVTHSMPRHWGDEIHEGPAYFRRNGKSYLTYSRHPWDASYTSAYMIGNSLGALHNATNPRFNFTEPIHARGCQRNQRHCIFENAGHGTVTERYGKYYYIYHKAFPASKDLARGTYISPMYFKPDGKIVHLTRTVLSWPSMGAGIEYSLDVKKRGGGWIGPCIGADIIGTKTNVHFEGLCPSAKNAIVHKGEVEQFRLYYAKNGAWSLDKRATIPNDLTKDQLYLNLHDKRPVAIVDDVINEHGSTSLAKGDNIRLRGHAEADGAYDVVAHRWVRGSNCFDTSKVIYHSGTGGSSAFWRSDYPEGVNRIGYVAFSRNRHNAKDVKVGHCITHEFVVGSAQCNHTYLHLCKTSMDCGKSNGNWCDNRCQKPACTGERSALSGAGDSGGDTDDDPTVSGGCSLSSTSSGSPVLPGTLAVLLLGLVFVRRRGRVLTSRPR